MKPPSEHYLVQPFVQPEGFNQQYRSEIPDALLPHYQAFSEELEREALDELDNSSGCGVVLVDASSPEATVFYSTLTGDRRCSCIARQGQRRRSFQAANPRQSSVGILLCHEFHPTANVHCHPPSIDPFVRDAR